MRDVIASSGRASKDTSFRDAGGNHVQQLRLDVDAPVAKVRWALTTSEGFQSWAAPVAQVTFGNVGMIETSYLMTAKIEGPDNIRNRIVAYVPERLLVFRNEHAPKGISFGAEAFSQVRTAVELQDLIGDRTRVTEAGVGYGNGKDFDSVYSHFLSGNAEEFDMLEKSLTKGPIDWKAEMGAVDASAKRPAAEN